MEPKVIHSLCSVVVAHIIEKIKLCIFPSKCFIELILKLGERLSLLIRLCR